jgi:hypothetical protein
VEIHVRSSDWFRHQHHENKSYDNVILHVVWADDRQVFRNDGERIPALEFRTDENCSLYQTWQHFLHNDLWIPCAREIGSVRLFVLNDWLSRLAIDRLEKRSLALAMVSRYHTGDMNQVFYHSLLSAMGFGLNKEPFEMLARQTPYRLTCKYRQDLVVLESLLFGQSGMLHKRWSEPYPCLMQKEYRYLRHKHRLRPVSAHLWKFLRLRPRNFPTIRIAQVAMLLHSHENLPGFIMDMKDPSQARDLLMNGTSSYWEDHYVFDRTSRRERKVLTEEAVDLIFLNHILPFLFFASVHDGDILFRERSIGWLEGMKPEDNAITRRFRQLGVKPQHAAHTQGLLELKKSYCDCRRCLDCRIGIDLFK